MTNTSERSVQGSVSQCLEALKVGDSFAQQRLWDKYMERLIRLAARKLQGTRGLVEGAEDVVSEAYNDFLKGAVDGRFPRLDDRQDLWQVLVMLTNRKAIGLQRKAKAIKRGEGNVRTESVFAAGDAEGSFGPGIAGVVSGDPTPQFAALMNEEVSERLRQLDSDIQRQIALYRMKGYSNTEIAKELGIAKRTVERKVSLIRDAWFNKLDS